MTRNLVAKRKTGNGMKAACLAVAVLATAGSAFYFGSGFHTAKAAASVQSSAAHAPVPSKSLSLPLFFEPNQGQTAPQVKFLARGSGYGLFLTSNEAVLTLRPSSSSTGVSALNSEKKTSSVIRMRLDGANTAAHVSGASPLPGKSNYFIGNNPSKWRQNIPQFARVEYKAVYPGIDLVYYGNQGQLEYDFRVAPGADANQIGLQFDGASARLDAGDLVLSTDGGDIRFHAPRIYQTAVAATGDSPAQEKVAGNFRQLADNKIGFAIGEYDHSRELVIDPTLTYSTYLGGGGAEGLVKVAVDSAGLIYVAGSTNSADFPTNIAAANNPNNPPYQLNLKTAGATNVFIAVINPSLVPPLYNCTQQGPYFCTQQLVYATYLGGSGVDSLAGIAVDNTAGIYVAGSTTSFDFPTTGNAFQATRANDGLSHGFFSKLSNVSQSSTLVYGLSYSTNLAGNGTDHVTGLAIDSGCVSQSCFAYLTGHTTSSNVASDALGFPANPNGFQAASNSPGNLQFFASKINPNGSGQLSMVYSTYFGGSNPVQAVAIGGGIAVDQSGSTPNMYITGTTNMLPKGLNGAPGFPLYAAQQACLNLASQTSCNGSSGGTNTDAFVAKISPTAGLLPVYSTYLGGSGNEIGTAIAVDSSGDAYITGSTSSSDWVNCGGFQCTLASGATNAFVAKIGGLINSIYPINYFTYLGGAGPDSGQDIKVDSLQSVHVVGNTAASSTGFPNLDPLLPSPISNYNGSTPAGGGDAFVALLGTTLSGKGAGDYVTYLGGSQLDHGTGVAIDNFGATYAAGDTVSPNFPTTPATAFQSGQNSGSQDAFVSRLGAVSSLEVLVPSTSPSPSPVNAGAPAAFTFDIVNTGPDNASFVTFYATVPTGLAVASQQAKITGGAGNCTALQGSTIVCNIQNLAVCTPGSCTTGAAVEVDVTPSITYNVPTITVSGAASANGGALQGSQSQTVNVVDFTMSAQPLTPVISAGATAQIQVNFCPKYGNYSGTITPAQTTSPSMVTASTPTFSPTSVTLAGTACSSTTLSIPTVPRPITTGSLLQHRSFYATWLPIGGLSIIGLGLGAGRKRRRWLIGAAMFVIVGMVALQTGCGSSSSAANSTGGTVAATYVVTISGAVGTGGSHTAQASVRVN